MTLMTLGYGPLRWWVVEGGFIELNCAWTWLGRQPWLTVPGVRYPSSDSLRVVFEASKDRGRTGASSKPAEQPRSHRVRACDPHHRAVNRRHTRRQNLGVSTEERSRTRCRALSLNVAEDTTWSRSRPASAITPNWSEPRVEHRGHRVRDLASRPSIGRRDARARRHPAAWVPAPGGRS